MHKTAYTWKMHNGQSLQQFSLTGPIMISFARSSDNILLSARAISTVKVVDAFLVASSLEQGSARWHACELTSLHKHLSGWLVSIDLHVAVQEGWIWGAQRLAFLMRMVWKFAWREAQSMIGSPSISTAPQYSSMAIRVVSCHTYASTRHAGQIVLTIKAASRRICCGVMLLSWKLDSMPGLWIPSSGSSCLLLLVSGL